MGEITPIVDWIGYQPLSSAAGRARLQATLFAVDQGDPVELVARPPTDRHLICVHLAGGIDWEARFDDRHYRAPAPPGTLNLGRAGEQAQVVYRDAHTRFLHFYLPVELPAAVLADSGLVADGLELIDPANAADPTVQRLALEALAAMRDGPAAALLLDTVGQALASHLVARWSNRMGAPLTRGATPIGEARIRRVLALIEERLHEDLGLVELAQEAGVSPSHLVPVFKAATGVTPYRWLLQRRLARSCALLAGSALPVTDIAHALGFASSQHFATAFRKVFGLAPTEWRRRKLS